MRFNSLQYVAFLPVVAAVFFLLPIRLRAIFLVAASCYFYMVFKPAYILILFAVIAIDYTSALYIERSAGARRRAGLVLSIASNVGILFIFKYYAFAAGNVRALADATGWHLSTPILDLILPIGLSFHTFQSLAYVIEVFYGRFPAERNPIRFALYVLFFPQMVAGPIERPQGLLRQLQHLDQPFSYDNAVAGLRLILIGYWCKLLVADNLAPYVDAVYANPAAAAAVPAALATMAFAVQIYCDFYGYSLIAIGSARLLGISLAPNFDHPYQAASVTEFWRRWHISLSSWFRDYVYIPLGGSRAGPLRRDLNIMIVFLLSGLWHGANWTYVLWGGLHGMYLLGERHLSRLTSWRPAFYTARAVVFGLVAIAWVFFRAATVADATTMLSAIVFKWSSAAADFQALWVRIGTRSLVQDAATGLIAFAMLTTIIEPIAARGWPQIPRMRWALYYAMIASIVVFAKFDSRSFIYFQF